MRHTVRTLASVALVTGCLVSCSSAEQEGPESPGSTGWSFTDDRGVQVSLDAVPQRIIAQVSAAGALKDFGVDVVGTFGPLLRKDGSVEPEAGSVDPKAVTDITGPGYGQINMELATSLRPDLLVSGSYEGFDGLWHLSADYEEKIRQVVPTVGIEQSGRPLPDAIAAYRKLAGALGGDVESERVRADEARFQEAAGRLRGLGDRLRADGRSILAIGGSPEEFFVAVPDRAPDLDYYRNGLGLPITVPRNPSTAGGAYFERLSWEHAGAYPADIYLWDTRSASMPPEQMKVNRLFAAQPAAAANRFVEWNAVAPMSYTSYAKIMNRLADQIEQQMATL